LKKNLKREERKMAPPKKSPTNKNSRFRSPGFHNERARKAQDPETPEQWQAAVDLADFLVCLDSARQYGLVAGGPEVDLERCDQILVAGASRGYRPRELCAGAAEK
jgi:hypothetical protein